MQFVDWEAESWDERKDFYINTFGSCLVDFFFLETITGRAVVKRGEIFLCVSRADEEAKRILMHEFVKFVVTTNKGIDTCCDFSPTGGSKKAVISPIMSHLKRETEN